MAKNTKDSLDIALNEANKELNNPAPVVSVRDTQMTVESNAAIQYNNLERKRKSLVTTYRNEEKRPVTISPFYAPYLGSVVRVSVNGIMVEIPANGSTYMINKTHADHVITKIKRIDAMLARQKRLGETDNNFEHAPGELHL